MVEIQQGETTTEKEYYHYGFQELCREVGEELALEKVKEYQNLSIKYGATATFVVHTCRLLITYQDPLKELEPVIELTPLDRQCSVFYKPVTNVDKQKHLDIWKIAELIRSNKFKKQTDHLRTITEKKANSAYKAAEFSYATFSGIFSKRSSDCLVQHSGLICLDLDHLNERLEEVRAIVNADTWTVMSFTSPNGDGLKVLYEMDTHLTQGEYYAAYSKRLRKLCNLEPLQVDKQCKDVSRACFLPHDPALFINPHFEKS